MGRPPPICEANSAHHHARVHATLYMTHTLNKGVWHVPACTRRAGYLGLCRGVHTCTQRTVISMGNHCQKKTIHGNHLRAKNNGHLWRIS